MNKVTVHNIKLYYITFPFFLTSAKKRKVKGNTETLQYIILTLTLLTMLYLTVAME